MFHALKVDFANEIATLCSKLNIDGKRVMEVFCADTTLNISRRYLKPGFAYGGPCLPKDVDGLSSLSVQEGLALPIIQNINASNLEHIRRVKEALLEMAHGRPLVFFGLNFKDDSVDFRGSPVVKLIEMILSSGSTSKILVSSEEIAALPSALASRVTILPTDFLATRYLDQSTLRPIFVVGHKKVSEAMMNLCTSQSIEVVELDKVLLGKPLNIAKAKEAHGLGPADVHP